MTQNRHTRRQVARECSRALILTPPTTSQVLAGLLALLALAIQILIVQPHIHVVRTSVLTQMVHSAASGSDVAASSASLSSDNAAPGPRDNYPINEDPANCPLCQEAVHSGQFVQSAAILAVLPFAATINFIVFDEIRTAYFAISHIWHGRAPPQD